MSQKLYIIHGWTYKPEPWEEVISNLKSEYGINAELLRVPGLGTQSSKVYTIEDYVEWAKSKIPKGSIALGHSNGGRILLNLSVKDKDYLGGMILLDAAGVWEESKKRDTSRKLSKVFAPLKKVEPLRKIVHKILGANDYDNAPENMKQTLTNMLDSDKDLDISLVKTPTAIVWGDEDQITPLRQGRKMHELIKGSTLTVKEGWRHSHYLRSVSELASEIAKQYKTLTEGKSAKR